MSRTLLKRLGKVEHRLAMTAVDDAELSEIDFTGLCRDSLPPGPSTERSARMAQLTKYFVIAIARYGITHEEMVARSWDPPNCPCEPCAQFQRRFAALHADIAKQRAKRTFARGVSNADGATIADGPPEPPRRA